MDKNLKTITIEQLTEINSSLADRIKSMARHLKCPQSDIQMSYWIVVECENDKMVILADNGYDITESIDVPIIDQTKITSCIK